MDGSQSTASRPRASRRDRVAPDRALLWRSPAPRWRGRPPRSRRALASRVLWMYSHWLPAFQWLRAVSRGVPPEVVSENLQRLGWPWPAYMDSIGWGRLARRVVKEPPSSLVLTLIGRHLELTRAATAHLLKDARRWWPGAEAAVRAGSLSRQLLAVWRRSRDPWALTGDRERALDAELNRIGRRWRPPA